MLSFDHLSERELRRWIHAFEDDASNLDADDRQTLAALRAALVAKQEAA